MFGLCLFGNFFDFAFRKRLCYSGVCICVFVFVVYAAASAVFVKDAVKDPVRASAAVNVIAISFFISVLQSLI